MVPAEQPGVPEDLYESGVYLGGPYRGGFVLGDSFDTFLRDVSVAYLQQAWINLSETFSRYRLELPADLSWGWLRPYRGNLPGPGDVDSPKEYSGWVSAKLAFTDERHSTYFHEDPQHAQLIQELRNCVPTLRHGIAYRSVKWDIAPDDFTSALYILEEMCTEEQSDWSPGHLLVGETEYVRDEDGYFMPVWPEVWPVPTEPWLKVARAIVSKDQGRLDEALL